MHQFGKTIQMFIHYQSLVPNIQLLWLKIKSVHGYKQPAMLTYPQVES